MLIDTHAHLNFGIFADSLDDVVGRTLDNNTYVIIIGSNYETSQRAIEIAEKYDGVWAVIGCHPEHLVEDIEEKVIFEGEEKILKIKKEIFDYKKYFDLAKSSKKVVGIGEMGLDFYYLKPEKHDIEKAKELEIDVFKQFIKLAKELNLPLVLHCRGEEGKNYEAYDLMLKILSSELGALGSEPKGVIHCFGGSLEQAKKFIDLGFYVGFTGIVTFKNAKELQEIAKVLPLDKILTETDSPYLAPVPFRGKVNEPSYVRYVAEKIAELKNINNKTVEEQTFKNAKALFQI
jgi:TatD DNase family protein